jgi:uncharacterized protein (DUF1778 family)
MGKGGSRPGSGRKPVKASLKRSVAITLWLRPSEARLVRKAAKAREESLPDWMRGACVRSARRHLR